MCKMGGIEGVGDLSKLIFYFGSQERHPVVGIIQIPVTLFNVWYRLHIDIDILIIEDGIDLMEREVSRVCVVIGVILPR